VEDSALPLLRGELLQGVDQHHGVLGSELAEALFLYGDRGTSREQTACDAKGCPPDPGLNVVELLGSAGGLGEGFGRCVAGDFRISAERKEGAPQLLVGSAVRILDALPLRCGALRGGVVMAPPQGAVGA